MAEYCAVCGCDSFECGGGVTGQCIRAVETDPIGCAVDAVALALGAEGTAANRSRISRALKLLKAAQRAAEPEREGPNSKDITGCDI